MVKHKNLGRWGNISITRFENDKGVSFNLQKSWKDDKGEYVNRSLSFFENEIGNVLLAVRKAVEG